MPIEKLLMPQVSASLRWSTGEKAFFVVAADIFGRSEDHTSVDFKVAGNLVATAVFLHCRWI